MADDLTPSPPPVPAPRLAIRALGTFSVELDGKPVVFQSSRSEMVLAYLALKRGAPVTRREVASAIWPGVEESNRNTSLRVALHKLKQELGEGLLEINRLTIGLSPRHVDLDLLKLDEIRADAAETRTERDRMEQLWTEWLASEKPLLEGMEAHWVETARVMHADRVVSLGYELFDLLDDAKDFSRAERVIRVLTKNDPEDLEAFEHALRTELNLGGMAAASKLLRESAINTYRTDFPRSLRRLVHSIRMGISERVGKPDRFTREQTMLLGKMFDANVSQRSDEALKLLAREAAKTSNWSHPRTLLSLCLASLEGSEFKRDAEIDLGITVCFLTTYTTDPETGIEIGNRLLEILQEEDPRAVRVRSILGFIHFESGNYDLSRKYQEEALAAATGLHLTTQRSRVLNRFGVLCMHLGSFDEAQSHFEGALKDVGKKAAHEDAILRISLHANLSHLECLRGEWAKAARWGKLVAAETDEESRVFQTTMAAYYGVALIKLRKHAEGVNWIARGLEETSQEGMKRMNCVALDFSALALATMGKSEDARRAVVYADWLRESLGVRRAPAEDVLLEQVRFGIGKEEAALVRAIAERKPSLFSVAKWAIQSLQKT
jgi:DNA-binding SARP family transcriptional activator